MREFCRVCWPSRMPYFTFCAPFSSPLCVCARCCACQGLCDDGLGSRCATVIDNNGTHEGVDITPKLNILKPVQVGQRKDKPTHARASLCRLLPTPSAAAPSQRWRVFASLRSSVSTAAAMTSLLITNLPPLFETRSYSLSVHGHFRGADCFAFIVSLSVARVSPSSAFASRPRTPSEIRVLRGQRLFFALVFPSAASPRAAVPVLSRPVPYAGAGFAPPVPFVPRFAACAVQARHISADM